MKKIFALLLVILIALNFIACGGGGGGGGGDPVSGNSNNSAETYSIQGKVMNGEAPVPNVTITLKSSDSSMSASMGASNILNISTVTDADGIYKFTNLPKGNYIIERSRAGYTFEGEGQIYVTITDKDVTGEDIAVLSTTGTYSIGGHVTCRGTGLSSVKISLTNTTTGAEVDSTTTNADGSYAFAGLENSEYTITPSPEEYIFAPVNLSVTISDKDITGKNFIISAPQFLHYTLPDQYNFLTNYPGKTVADEPVILFSAYTLTEGILYKDGTTLVSGYALGQFVDKDKVNASTPDPDGVLGANDARKLYSVVVRSNQDGFTNRTKFVGSGLYNADLRWDQYILGYLLDLNYSGRTYFPDSNIDIANMYNTKYAYDIYMFRKIDVKRPDADGSLVTFEPQATTESYVNDATYTTATTLTTTKFTVTTRSFGDFTNVKVISLVQFLTEYVTNSPGSYTYKIVAVDDTFKEGWTYADMQQAYYLPDYDIIIRLDASNNIISGTMINYPVRIELISGSIVEYDYSAKNPPAFAKAY